MSYHTAFDGHSPEMATMLQRVRREREEAGLAVFVWVQKDEAKPLSEGNRRVFSAHRARREQVDSFLAVIDRNPNMQLLTADEIELYKAGKIE